MGGALPPTPTLTPCSPGWDYWSHLCAGGGMNVYVRQRVCVCVCAPRQWAGVARAAAHGKQCYRDVLSSLFLNAARSLARPPCYFDLMRCPSMPEGLRSLLRFLFFIFLSDFRFFANSHRFACEGMILFRARRFSIPHCDHPIYFVFSKKKKKLNLNTLLSTICWIYSIQSTIP